MMSILMVTYVGGVDSRFDRTIYDTHHIPLVERTWAPFGLERTEVFYAVDPAAGPNVVAMCLCHFADRAGVDRALAAPESVAVADDIPTFTDIAPMRTVIAAADA